MPKKLTYEFVKERFESEGYELLEDNYICAHTKMKYRCYEGHNNSMIWNSWQRGHRCPDCASIVQGIRQLKDIKFIKEQFKKENYTLLSKEHNDSKIKLNYICSKGHSNNTTWGNWYNGARCPTCAGQAKPTLEFVRAEFEKYDYILLSKEYIGSKSKLDYTCSEGHNNSMIWNSWQRGCRCPTCRDLNRFGSGHYNWKGGISIEPYCDAWKDKQYKADIKKRDNFTCQNPDCWGTTDKLAIHHIDYDKKNCHPSNLITVCISCNSRANTNRSWHTDWYSTLINNKVRYING